MQCLWNHTGKESKISVKCLKVLKPQNLASAGVYQQENTTDTGNGQYNAENPRSKDYGFSGC